MVHYKLENLDECWMEFVKGIQWRKGSLEDEINMKRMKA